MPIPFKKGCPELSYNKTMAEGRLQSLSKKLKGDDILYEKYKAEMQNLLDKGYAEKVPSNEIGRDDGRVWYLPHHPVFHPQKPDKVRIVFDCAAKHSGTSTSLYDNVMQGPDF